MNKLEALKQTNQILKQRNFLVLTCSVLILSNLLLAFALVFQDKEKILVPNSLDQEASIVNGRMSPAYIEALTRDVINLMLNVTPSNVEYTAKSILKITHPKFYGTLKTSLLERTKDVINRHITLFFAPQSIILGDEPNTVYVTGKLSTILGKTEVSTEEKTYSIIYEYVGFKPLVLDFHEVDPKAKEEEGADEKAS